MLGVDRIAVEERDANPSLLALVNDNDFGLVLPIPEQLDVLRAPPVCSPSPTSLGPALRGLHRRRTDRGRRRPTYRPPQRSRTAGKTSRR